MASTPNPAAKLAHVRPVRPLLFPEQEPESEHLGQHPRHFDLLALLHVLLMRVCGDEHAVSADMFVYWDASDPRMVRAPDAAIKLGLRQELLIEEPSWKVWELGVPEVVVEVLSLSDTREKWTLAEKREAYERMGVREFVCFDLDAPIGARLRVWDRIEGDFVERIVEGESTPCLPLSMALGSNIAWTVAPGGRYPAALRLRRNGELVPSPEEVVLEARTRADEERTRADEERARADAAVARIAELEAMLRQR